MKDQRQTFPNVRGTVKGNWVLTIFMNCYCYFNFTWGAQLQLDIRVIARPLLLHKVTFSDAW